MKQQRAVQSCRSIVLLGLVVLAPLAVAAEDDYNIYSRLQELQQQSAATTMASAEMGQSGSHSGAAVRGVKGPIRSDPSDDAVAEQLQRPWRDLGGIGGEGTN
jgi:hypothetical protein